MKPQEKILNSFFELKESSIYYNQIKEHSGLSHSSLQNTLKKLEEFKILKQEKTKSNVFYKINDKKIVSLRFSEIAVNKYNNLNRSVRVPLNNFLKNIPSGVFTIVLFGSASRGKEKKGSDIDLLIVSENKISLDKNKKEAEITSTYPISLFYCNTKSFLENKDDVIIQARKTGFPIYGEQNFYEVILDGY